MKGVNPAWSNLPRRHCDDCGKKYKPARPVKENERGFCSDNCRKSYHKHGGAYRKLRGEVRKMIDKEFSHIKAEMKELRALWIEAEERWVKLSEVMSPQEWRSINKKLSVSPLPNPQPRA